MAKKSGNLIPSGSPTHEEVFEQGYENSSMASEHMGWKTDITPVMAPVVDQPHEEVGEVHQGDWTGTRGIK